MITEIIKTETVLGKVLHVYGTPEDPLFVAKNVADWVGISNVSQMMSPLDIDEKMTYTIHIPGQQQRKVLMVTEFGLYEILMLSRKSVAKAFKKAVKKILHELRTKGLVTGANITRSQLAQMVLESEKELKVAEDKLALQHPKIKYYDEVMQSEGLIPVTIIAKGMGMTGQALNKALHEKGIIFQMGKTWMLYAEYDDKGYTDYDIFTRHGEEVSRRLKWTEKGCEFVHQIMKTSKA